MTKSGLLESLLLFSGGHRHLQQFPNYTSPPLPEALDATPEAFRSDQVIDDMRALAGDGNCTATGNRCHIPFPPPLGAFDSDEPKIGVIFYCGGLVDPRGYSPIASVLSTRYGIPTVIPVFFADIAFTFGICNSGRLEFAKAEFPNVEKWILAGHSFGGVSAMVDMWDFWSNNTDDSAAGLVLLAADIQGNLGCGPTDFSNTNLPMASLTGTLDDVLNRTRWEENKVYLSNATFIMDIYGGNHAYFGAYDSSQRFDVLGQTDGEALIPRDIQLELVTSAIVHVASRTGVTMPIRSASFSTSSTDGEPIQQTDRCNPSLEESGTTSGVSNAMTIPWTAAVLLAVWCLA